MDSLEWLQNHLHVLIVSRMAATVRQLQVRTIQSVKEFHLAIGFITVTDLGTTGLEIFCIWTAWDFYDRYFGLESATLQVVSLGSWKPYLSSRERNDTGMEGWVLKNIFSVGCHFSNSSYDSSSLANLTISTLWNWSQTDQTTSITTSLDPASERKMGS